VVLVTTNDPRYNVKASPTLDELIAQQGKLLVTDVRLLHGEKVFKNGRY
jgi:hypothetical protein